MVKPSATPHVLVLAAAIALAVLSSAVAHAQPAAATPESAAPFVGDWTLALQGPNGPATFVLSVKVAEGKVTGEISSEQQAKQTITDVSKNATSLLLRYSFDYQGNAVPALVTLTPDGDKIGATIDFADGAYVLAGTATKKA